ncbi:demethylmenaquinone methyltransferase [Lentilactobacillus otakiensis]|uniref:Demethylmenaquinone methyltransferase n=1 Tax=Lentilactobacillus otakiensis DSM 19908 = JCM 15040 TaxID=1423780 RepID=S4NQ55_9LACO|nr:demethylmenaquinone methyltransferase [Lentilactobacillus otakiensis]KRL10431.1 ubiquinone menaquinone biosynthesis methyltransferase ubiE [Lentilactobacillus otakiensis DSM 19908 = JCM 15040]MBZ3777099.1 demethylmenaquinone methyltransferase [Lentilactobacillus otakiensis]MDV3518123.1 demethylmenaquinone methyltransferase [Lentilactobacillus otakiensis]GAD16143.1 ubiquinone/menaquinone biosynthesis methyltransferase ubiE [Lentilactobacillus otakiensis DSM 19908 = JCM 15040]
MSLTNKTPETKVESLFDQIADNYDGMNSLISLGNHKHWRKLVMKQLNVQPGSFAIDVCCGTGDWTIALARAVGPSGQVIGLDFSEEMLKIAEKKVAAAGLRDRVTLVKGDAMHLPYDDNQFDLATIGFGLRNVPDADQVLHEMTRVIHDQGRVACLETSKPTNPIIKLGWRAYFNLVPIMAKLTVNKYQEYSYLQRTTAEFVSAAKLVEMFQNAGLTDVSYRQFTFGAAAFHLGTKHA